MDSINDADAWDFPLVYGILNLIFLVSYVALFLRLRFKLDINFDKFQITCILLFCLVFICNYCTLI